MSVFQTIISNVNSWIQYVFNRPARKTSLSLHNYRQLSSHVANGYTVLDTVSRSRRQPTRRTALRDPQSTTPTMSHWRAVWKVVCGLVRPTVKNIDIIVHVGLLTTFLNLGGVDRRGCFIVQSSSLLKTSFPIPYKQCGHYLGVREFLLNKNTGNRLEN